MPHPRYGAKLHLHRRVRSPAVHSFLLLRRVVGFIALPLPLAPFRDEPAVGHAAEEHLREHNGRKNSDTKLAGV